MTSTLPDSFYADGSHAESVNTPSVGSEAAAESEHLESVVVERLFMQALLKNVRAGVIYVDTRNIILFWNQTMEQLTGMRGSSMFGKHWRPTKLNLSTKEIGTFTDQQCPAQEAMRSGNIVRFAGEIVGRGGRAIQVNFQAIPVSDRHGEMVGAALLIDDDSSQHDLKKQIEAWHARATLDPLTQVANRAEMERTLEFLVRKNREKSLDCCVIICDIDFFKKINDDYGHHIGDQALISFARTIEKFTRVEDLLARYGGEEFVLVCVNCDLDTGVERAEEIRIALESTPQSSLEGKCIRASFGVAQMMPSDNATDVFIRADQALLKAKELGRNQVVKASGGLGSGGVDFEAIKPGSITIERQNSGDVLLDEELSTAVPVAVMIEKLKGFVAEQNADILEVDSNRVKIQINGLTGDSRRATDRQIPMMIELFITEFEPSSHTAATAQNDKSALRTVIQPTRSRDRRKSELLSYADAIKAELYSYLMISSSANQAKIQPAATESGRLPL